ncbi:twin-arginine translocase subunit TatC [Bacillus sp. SCS-153A]|uniref:twin-arginine translocase subunit TatC n=1 Tax=Rossellomorea sedimentorum TaxID=3115294 RepID=UPI003906CD84
MVLGIFIAFFLISFVFVKDIYNWIVHNLEFKLSVLGPLDIPWIYLMLAGVAAITFTLPILGYHIWAYISPALTSNERKESLIYIPLLFILFVTGMMFGYYLIFPQAFNFLVSLNEGSFQTFFTVEKYFRFLINMTVPVAFTFDLPIIIMFLTSIGIINPYSIKKLRKFVYFVLVVLSTMITPPDIVSAIIVVIPLILLFEISISISFIVYKRKIARANTAAEV